MAFDSLSEKLQNIFKNLRGKGRLSEADVKAALKEAGVTGEYYDQAVKFLANNELTAEQATAVKNEIKAAKATAGEAKSVADLSADQISKIKANIETAAAKVGAKVSFADKTISVTDAKGTQYTVSSNPVKGVMNHITVTLLNLNLFALSVKENLVIFISQITIIYNLFCITNKQAATLNK